MPKQNGLESQKKRPFNQKPKPQSRPGKRKVSLTSFPLFVIQQFSVSPDRQQRALLHHGAAFMSAEAKKDFSGAMENPDAWGCSCTSVSTIKTKDHLTMKAEDLLNAKTEWIGITKKNVRSTRSQSRNHSPANVRYP